MVVDTTSVGSPAQLRTERTQEIAQESAFLDRADVDGDRTALAVIEFDAQTEKVFKVFRMHEPQTTFVPLDQLLG